ncbi:WD and tetratricopeptide repeats protein 1-like [Uloborus diversus]|uniref:WD and tetratricopeptide repeats protein 1-like n=1 Tax=Uloborus diversus TaxID=327109 RepID=UPI002409CF7B|nr:WD and tetratricopeptide repeats protein 1-like [Uloborus diversus]
MFELGNLIKYQNRREREVRFLFYFQRKMHVTKELINRLGLEKEMKGHAGCVNCLEWNEKGTLIASGSDDLQVMLWDPYQQKRLECIQTGHQGNIFSVKFLPNSDDRTIITGAADFRIRVHDLASKETTMSCSCHGGRVKRLAVTPSSPTMLWSAAEDGIIMQYDLRMPHQCSNICNNVLINLVCHLGRNAEAKCVTINPMRPELLAVGANDPFVRLYDRRMIKPTTAKFPREPSSPPWDNLSYVGDSVEPGEDNLHPGCVSYFVAGHLPLKQDDFKRRYRTLTATYVAFSPDGSEMLANLGGEQIYLFDILKRRKQMSFDMSEFIPPTKEADDVLAPKNGSTTNGLMTNSVTSFHCEENHSDPNVARNAESVNRMRVQSLPTRVERIKRRANEAFEKREYPLAISLYSKAIFVYPEGATLYANRAAAYLRRAWDGDFYAAVRDCHVAMKLDPNYLKVHFRLIQCLHKLGWVKESWDCLQKEIIYIQSSAKSTKADVENEETESSGSSSGNPVNPPRSIVISSKEKAWRSSTFDYESRYCGHCNTTTDIKEANFFGSYGQYIVAGSDDGSIFIWDKITTNIVRVLRGDDSIVNCLQPHPTTCLLATSGIDPVVRLWGPKAEDGSIEDREIIDSEEAAISNQRRMNADPLEIMLMNMGYRLPGVLEQMSEEFEQHNGGDRASIVQCRTS